jgi:hypothetical protein
MDVLAVYDTKEKIESKFTPDLLAQLLLEVGRFWPQQRTDDRSSLAGPFPEGKSKDTGLGRNAVAPVKLASGHRGELLE